MDPRSPDGILRPAEPEAIAGLVERVTFHSAESGFCVLRVKLRGRRDLATVVGHAPLVSPGEFIQAVGRWVSDCEHGPQFRAETLRIAAPTTAEGIERYLASGMIRGVGPAYARRLVAAFGEAVFDVIEAAPERLRDIGGIGPARAASIVAGWAQQKAVREIMLFLHRHGVATSRAVRIYKTYGADAIAVLTENPYRLASDIRGIGFRSADQIAMRLGVARDAPMRLAAGVAYALARAAEEGHCGLPRETLLAGAAELLEAAPAAVEAALEPALAENLVVADRCAGRDCLFTPALHRAERDIAARLVRLAAGAPPWPGLDAALVLPRVEAQTGLTLADSQRRALGLALVSKLLVITGGPGVGKTTLLRAILAALTTAGVTPALAAPTGRAARRLSDTTGLPAKTLHRLLETDPRTGGFRRREDNPLDCDLLVVDETSMVDVALMRALLRALPTRSALLLVGDVDQLPSVGPDQVLADVIGSGAVPVVRLTEVFRQAEASRIIVNAHRINRGLMPEADPPGETPSDFYVIEAADPERAVERIRTLVRERIPRAFGVDPVRDIQVLCPMNRGAAGARALTQNLQALLNPPGALRVERFGSVFGPGDKIMQVVNNYDRDVYNGDVGVVATIDLETGTLVARFDGREVAYPVDELDELVLAYATTIHKSQGSEYPVVVIPVLTQHYTMLARNLIYTGVTRGRRLVVLVGQRKAIAMAVRRAGGQRWTKLKEWLTPAEAAASV